MEIAPTNGSGSHDLKGDPYRRGFLVHRVIHMAPDLPSRSLSTRLIAAYEFTAPSVFTFETRLHLWYAFDE